MTEGAIQMYQNIEAERARQQLTQEELANQLGITRKTYYLKQLHESFSQKEILKLSSIFDCDPNYLVEKRAK